MSMHGCTLPLTQWQLGLVNLLENSPTYLESLTPSFRDSQHILLLT